jgi:meiotic recombination protein DMC1
VDIDAIQAHGIGAVDIAKLKANGYYTVASVHSATRRNLLKIKGFSEIKVDKVKDAIAKCQVCSYRESVEVNLLTPDTAFWRRLPNCS